MPDHKMTKTTVQRDVTKHVCSEEGCAFFGKEAQQGVCHTSEGEIAEFAHTKYKSRIFLSGDVTRQACAEPDPQPGWFSRLCSLPDGHDGDHVDGITGRSWPRWEPRDHVEAGLIAALSVGDQDAREVYADWLEGRGETDRAAYVRPVPLGPRRSKLVLEPGWMSVVRRAILDSAFGGPE